MFCSCVVVLVNLVFLSGTLVALRSGEATAVASEAGTSLPATLIALIANHSDTSKYDLSSLTQIMYGGSPTRPAGDRLPKGHTRT